MSYTCAARLRVHGAFMRCRRPLYSRRVTERRAPAIWPQLAAGNTLASAAGGGFRAQTSYTGAAAMRFAAILLVLVPAEALTITRRHSFGLGAAGAAALGSALPAAAVREGSTKSGLRFRVEVEGSGDTPKRGQQALLDYVLRVGVDGKPPLYARRRVEPRLFDRCEFLSRRSTAPNKLFPRARSSSRSAWVPKFPASTRPCLT